MLSLYLCADVSIRQETVVVPLTQLYSKVLVFTIVGEYSSVHDTNGDPPKASAEVCVPAPAKLSLAVIKAPPVDHDVPLYTSVHAPTGAPPKASPAFCVPAPANRCLAVIKAPPAVHDVPSYSSVHANVAKDGDPTYPPKASPAFCSPSPANRCLTVIKAPPSVSISTTPERSGMGPKPALEAIILALSRVARKLSLPRASQRRRTHPAEPTPARA